MPGPTKCRAFSSEGRFPPQSWPPGYSRIFNDWRKRSRLQMPATPRLIANRAPPNYRQCGTRKSTSGHSYRIAGAVEDVTGGCRKLHPDDVSALYLALTDSLDDDWLSSVNLAMQH